jgi:glyoxylase-like metal-dependent hydrolase (beta-lactamase superfamily II)
VGAKRTQAGKRPREEAAPGPGRKAAGDRLRVRMYNVLFGDAILVTITEGDESRHILIDVGNVTGHGGDVDVFKPVIDDVLRELDGRPLDLYVMTHEHMDHVKGLLFADEQLKLDLKKRLEVRQAWLTGSAAPDYYDTHEDARKKRLEASESMKAVTRFLIARHLAAAPAGTPSAT